MVFASASLSILIIIWSSCSPASAAARSEGQSASLHASINLKTKKGTRSEHFPLSHLDAMFAPRTPLRRNEQQQQQQQQEGALHDAQPSSSSEVQQNANAESIQLGADASEPVKQNGFIASFMSDK